jgi:hypothetical protein
MTWLDERAPRPMRHRFLADRDARIVDVGAFVGLIEVEVEASV